MASSWKSLSDNQQNTHLNPRETFQYSDTTRGQQSTSLAMFFGNFLSMGHSKYSFAYSFQRQTRNSKLSHDQANNTKYYRQIDPIRRMTPQFPRRNSSPRIGWKFPTLPHWLQSLPATNLRPCSQATWLTSTTPPFLGRKATTFNIVYQRKELLKPSLKKIRWRNKT